MAPGGATVRALLSLPAGAASGNAVVPGAALFAYGSADVGDGGGCCAGGFCVCAANAASPNAAHTTTAESRCLTVILSVMRFAPRKIRTLSDREVDRARRRGGRVF